MQLKINQNDHNYINHIKRLPCEPSESPSEDISQAQSEAEGDRAILEFRRQIEERFKLSVANKLYSFPRRIQSPQDLISSDQDSQQDQTMNDQQQSEALRPIQRIHTQNKQIRKDRKQNKPKQRVKQEQKIKPFKRKQIYYVRQSSGHKPNQDANTPNNLDNKVKVKKKTGKSKERSKQKKQDSFRAEKERQTNRSKRFNTQPDNYNYVQTLRPKNKK